MAVIKSGVLIGLSKSAGGLTFYNRKGVQVVRSKPQLSRAYVPTDRQLFYKQLFSYVNDFAKSSQSLMRLISGGWGWSRHRNGSTNLNNFIGYMIRLMSRAEGGRKLPFETVQVNLQEFLANPFYFWLGKGASVASSWPIIYNFQVELVDGPSVRVRLPDVSFQEWIGKVSAASGKFRTGSVPWIVFIKQNRNGTVTDPITFKQMTGGNPYWEASDLLIDPDNTNWNVAVCVTADNDISPLMTSDLAVSPILDRFANAPAVDPVPSPIVTRVWSAGGEFPSGSPFVLGGSIDLNITGTNLDSFPLSIWFYGDNTAYRMDELFTLVSASPELYQYRTVTFSPERSVRAIGSTLGVSIEWPEEPVVIPVLEAVSVNGVDVPARGSVRFSRGDVFRFSGSGLTFESLRFADSSFLPPSSIPVSSNFTLTSATGTEVVAVFSGGAYERNLVSVGTTWEPETIRFSY